MCAATLDGATISLMRREDMLALDLQFTNVSLSQDGAKVPLLAPTNPALPASVKVIFPPQAIAEQVFQADILAPGVRADALFTGNSEILFTLPSTVSIPFTPEGLLSWAGLVGVADRTFIECVWGLVVQPAFAPHDTWLHKVAADTTPDGVTSLWHTRMARRSLAGAPDITAADPPVVKMATIVEGDPAFRNSLPDRSIIAGAADLKPVKAHELTLSALGATLSLVGDWSGLSAPGGIQGYRHRMVMGRDQTVQVTQRGYLLPFGFPVMLETCTDRGAVKALMPGGETPGSAALIQTSRLSVLIPEVRYDQGEGMPHEGRGFPLRAVQIHEPPAFDVEPGTGTFFWLNSASSSSSEHYLPRLTGIDYEGNTIAFRAPVIFVAQELSSSDLSAAIDQYNQERSTARPAVGRLALAVGADPGKSSVDLTAIYVGAEVGLPNQPQTRGQNDRFPVFPALSGVDARIPAVDTFGGTTEPTTTAKDFLSDFRPVVGSAISMPTPGPRLKLEQHFIDSGFAAGSAPNIYARLIPPLPFSPPQTSAGGLAALAVPATALSTTTGLVGGQLDEFRNGMFDPQAFFAPPNLADLPNFPIPTLLGFISIPEIVTGADIGDGEKVPRITTELIYPNGDHTRPPQAVRSTVVWRPAIKTLPPPAGSPPEPEALAELQTNYNGGQTTLDLTSEITDDLTGAAPVTSVQGSLRSFALKFVDGLLIVHFDRLTFTSHGGAAPSLDVHITKVEPGLGAVRFIEQLLNQLPTPSNGPKITYHDNAIEASYTLAPPPLEMGVFLMQNLAVTAAVVLPLDGRKIATRFAISSRENPFLVTVSLFGGGGFLAIELSGADILQLEFQIDFGAATALDLGVASAAVSVTANIHVIRDERQAALSGFFRAVGQVDVLGVVGVSVEIYMGLTYRSAPKPSVVGEAKVTIRVHVLFFAQAVTFDVARSFSGGHDPTFDVAFPTADPWQQYCSAFAPMVQP